MGPIGLSEIDENNLKKILERNKLKLEAVKNSVQDILNDVNREGDRAVLRYTRLYDRVTLSSSKLKVSEAEIDQAVKVIPPNTLTALEKAVKNIREIHKAQMPKERVLKKEAGIIVKQIFRPLKSVGIYIPGGRAPLASTALMLSIPAKIAGVKRLIACTPPTSNDGANVNPVVLAALKLGGVDEVYRVGGVQAIGAMAYGTDSIRCVEKIVGPGNIYVTSAKLLVHSEGKVGVDFVAGPSEILIFADASANPHFILADMLSQAEHDPLSVPILVTTSKNIANEVKKLISATTLVPPQDEAFSRHGSILVAKSAVDAVSFINRFAPEHLEIMTQKPEEILPLIENAGSISVGSYTPVAATDYAVGSCHVLPTAGSAQFTSGLTVQDFLKVINVQTLTRRALESLKDTILTLAEVEGMRSHRLAVEGRFN
jgi:histidinol dehydrogenase